MLTSTNTNVARNLPAIDVIMPHVKDHVTSLIDRHVHRCNTQSVPWSPYINFLYDVLNNNNILSSNKKSYNTYVTLSSIKNS